MPPPADTTIDPSVPSKHVGSVSLVTAIVTAGGLDAYGSWAELIAATTEDRVWCVVSMFQHRSSRRAELDIGVGAGGSEVPIMAALPFFKSNGDQEGVTYSAYHYFPISVPSGSRIAARIKDNSVQLTPFTVGAFVT